MTLLQGTFLPLCNISNPGLSSHSVVDARRPSLHTVQHLTSEDPSQPCVQDERSNWRIQAVSKSPGSFENRLSLPAAWQGLRDEELSKVSGIPGGVFVHASGFIGGNKTHDGVLAMAKGALEQAGEPAVKKPRT